MSDVVSAPSPPFTLSNCGYEASLNDLGKVRPHPASPDRIHQDYRTFEGNNEHCKIGHTY